MKRFLINQFKFLDKKDFFPKNELWIALSIFLAWALPAFLFAVWANKFYPDNKVYHLAIKEGIGPNLWNVIGILGFFSFGIALSLSKFSVPSFIAKNLLANTYTLGSLTFGLLAGQWCFLPFDELIWWQQGLFGVTSFVLFIIFFFYNFVIWYLSFLLKRPEKNKSVFLASFNKMHWSCRIGLGLLISSIALFVLLSSN